MPPSQCPTRFSPLNHLGKQCKTNTSVFIPPEIKNSFEKQLARKKEQSENAASTCLHTPNLQSER